LENNWNTDVFFVWFRLLREKASSFLLDDFYRTPGGIQYEGPGSDAKPITLTIENQDYMGDIEILKDYLSKVHILNTALCLPLGNLRYNDSSKK
jgi:hypothetical protein